MKCPERVRQHLTQLGWFVRGMLGANGYQTYLAHHYASCCDHPPVSEKQFWRDYFADQEVNPSARCC